MTLTRKQARRLPPAGGTPREVAEAINNIFNGLIGVVGEATLAASAASTVVTDTRCTVDSAVVLEPITANAAAERGGTALYTLPASGSFTIYHANNSQTDRTFRYVVLT